MIKKTLKQAEQINSRDSSKIAYFLPVLQLRLKYFKPFLGLLL